MKFSPILTCILLLSSFIATEPRAQTPVTDAATLADAAKVQVQVQLPPKGLNHRLTPVVTISTNELGQITQSTNSYWHLETGIHYQDDQGELQPSVAAFEVKASKVTAETLQHKVRLDANINTKGSVAVVLPDGTKLRSHVSGLRYSDPTTGKAVVISEVKDSQAYLVSSNQVVYFDAFKDVSADVRYTVTLAGLEQDILLHEAPPAPESYGISSATSRLEVLTEFVNPPSAKKLAKRGQRLPEGLDRPLETRTRTEQEDVAVDFGAMRIGEGRAFRSDTQKDSPIGVGKSWLVADKREFLVEAVELQIAAPMLQGLPVRKQGAGLRTKDQSPPGTSPKLQASHQAIPSSRGETGSQMTAQKGWPADRPKPQSTEARSPELVLDYVSMLTPTGVKQALPDFTFQGDQTYYIKGNYFLYGTTTLEGGAVLKFAKYDRTNDISLWIGGNLVCNTSPYRPAVFTACDDNTVGVTLPSTLSTGTVDPGAIYGVRGLGCWYGAPAWDVHDIRFIGQGYALYLGNQANNKIHNVQIASRGWAWTVGIHIAGNPASTTPYTNYVGNVLFSSLGAAIGYETPVGQTVTLDFENITSDNNYLFCPPSTESKFREVRIKNSLLGPLWNTVLNDAQYFPGTQFTDLGGNQVIRDRTAWASTFTTALAGKFYLADASPLHGTGTQKGNAILYTDLATASTYAPQTLTAALTDGTTLPPRVARDVNVADPGYHYPALDYLVRNLPLNASANVSLVKGVSVGWSGPYAFTLQNGSSFSSRGLPDAMNHLVHHSLVQEAPPTVGAISTFAISPANTTPPKLSLRFTEIASLGGRGDLILPPSRSAGDPVITPLILADSLFGGMQFQYVPAPGYYPMVTVANNVFDRGYFGLHAGLNGNAYLTAAIFNNTFYRLLSETGAGRFVLNGVANQPAWQVVDNVFDRTPVQILGTWTGTFDYNAFPNGTIYLGSHVITGTLSYTNGPLGRWYQVGTGFQDTGSRAAVFAGLSLHTTRTDQSIEGISPVDPGFHYIATKETGSTTPRDLDDDKIPDYLEDSDGDSVVDPVENSQGTNPYDPYDPIPRRLAHWQFNKADLTTEDGGSPTIRSAPLVESYDGTAASFTSPTHQLVHPVTWKNGTTTMTNINFWNGSLRFTYVPSWFSKDGDRPNAECRLIECGNWRLFVTADGRSIVFQTPTTNGTIRTNLVAGFPSRANVPPGRIGVEIELNYSPARSWIVTRTRRQDRYLVVSETGVQADLPASVKAGGLRIGSGSGGVYPAQGFIDELETFNATTSAFENKSITNEFASIFGRNTSLVDRKNHVMSATDTDAGILLSWIRVWEGDWLTNRANYRIQRRDAGTTTWSTVAPEVRASSWMDTSVASGAYYEYRVAPDLDAANDDGEYPTIAAAHRGAAIDSRGTAILLIDRTIAASIAAELESYKRDLIADGWAVVATNVPRHIDLAYPTPDGPSYISKAVGTNAANAAGIKNYISNLYALNPGGTNVVFLIGHVAIPYSGFDTGIDGHTERNGALPTDAWYGDMTGTWTDTKSVQANNPINSNLVNDGRWDQDTLPLEADGSPGKLEIAVGRIDFAVLKPYRVQEEDLKITEIRVLKKYLDKSARFRRSLIPFKSDSISWLADYRFQNLIPTVQRLQTRLWNNEIRPQYLYDEDPYRAAMNHLWGIHGDTGGFEAIGNNQSQGRQHTSADVALEKPENSPKGVFQLHFGSNINEWFHWDADPLRVALGVSNAVLSTTWLNIWQGTYWKADRMHSGGHLGFALQDTFAEGSRVSCRTTALLGDPFLREFPLPPVASLSSIKSGVNISLSWTPNLAATSGYRIYRASSADPTSWTWKADVAAGSSGWTNVSLGPGKYSYLIKSMALQSNASGSFTNLSIGTQTILESSIP